MRFYIHDYHFDFFQFKKYFNCAGKAALREFPGFLDSLAPEKTVIAVCEFLTRYSTELEQKSGKPFGKILKIEGLNDPHHQNGNRETSLLKNAKLFYEWQNKLSSIYVELLTVADKFCNVRFLYTDQYNLAIASAEKETLQIMRKVFPLFNIGDKLFPHADSICSTLKLAHDNLIMNINVQESRISYYRDPAYHENRRQILEQQTKMNKYDWIRNSGGLTVGELRARIMDLPGDMRVLIEINREEDQYIEDVELRQHASPDIESVENLYITIKNN